MRYHYKYTVTGKSVIGIPAKQAATEYPKCHFAAPAGGQERSEKSYNVNNNNIPTIRIAVNLTQLVVAF